MMFAQRHTQWKVGVLNAIRLLKTVFSLICIIIICMHFPRGCNLPFIETGHIKYTEIGCNFTNSNIICEKVLSFLHDDPEFL